MGRRFALAFSLLGCALSLSSPSVMAGERIVSIGPATTELILALGGEQSLVATDVSSPEPRGVPKVGYHRALAAEGILSLAPTLVVGSDEMGPSSTLDQLRRAGVEVKVMATAPTLANLNERIDTLAGLLGNQAAGTRLKAEIAAQSDKLAAQAKQNKPLKVAFLLLHKGQPTSIAGGNTTASALVTLAGGVNPVVQLHDYKPVSTESLIELQPDLVLVSGRDWQQFQNIDSVLAQVPALAATPAGKNRAIHAIDGHALQGGLSLRSLQQANQIAQWIKQGS
ncbi:ABC transporter substrate-binding protein [Aeromonas sanarellii]|uniref:ABC transporter substrate-binding protein n=1 Tax=Aeromonas sanarellii TaxID=633415 RepID=A0ABS4BAZ2_9GAMM|nr:MULTISPECIES: helical backbone metal receptor [Aeromonas]MBP0603965.1 ABC transporter substrate-binding protein [Aeromonas sanarellii]QXC30536.1 ABC transporter substrate-binding protein [Aeromonas sp. FDAARGOS 1409]